MKIDLPIGFRFLNGDDILEVRRSSDCSGCYFDGRACDEFSCTSCGRWDENEVYFLKIGVVHHE